MRPFCLKRLGEEPQHGARIEPTWKTNGLESLPLSLPSLLLLDQDCGSVGQGGGLAAGAFRSLKGPGLFFIIPIIETIPYWIDTRVITRSFKAEKTLTKDTVPVDVDAVLFWKVVDPKKAALDVADYQSAISWASQTALRDVIGKTMLSDMLEGREKISTELQKIIDERTEPWGINVISVEVKDVLIPCGPRGCDVDAGPSGERTSGPRDSGRFGKTGGGEIWEKRRRPTSTIPIALHLRAMNMLYEGLKQNSTIVIVPSSAVETMQLVHCPIFS